MPNSSRIGIFGGTFNPIHLGHINSMLTVADRLKLKTVKVVPAGETPLKQVTEGATVEDRVEMVKRAISEYPEVLELDEIEVKKTGVSFTIETINEYKKKFIDEEIYLIIGADQFEIFDQWKDFEKILKSVNLVVTSRPGTYLPLGKEDFPLGLQPLIAELDNEMAVLTTGQSIQFVRLKDQEVSASEVRKKIRTGKSVAEYLDAHVERYIVDNGLYNLLDDKIEDFGLFCEFCAQALFDRKAIDVKGFDLTSLEMPSDYTIIASGTSSRHTTALAENLVKRVNEEYGVYPYNIEGKKEGRWVVVDYGNLLIHVFYDYVRQEYRLEELWTEGKNLNLVDKDLPQSKKN